MNTKLRLNLVLPVFIIIAMHATGTVVFAESQVHSDTMDVVASGVGMNETEAKKDALGNAVRQAIGAIVGVDTLIENEDVVRDQILTYSDGFVKTYEVVGSPETTSSGLSKVTIRAQVVRGKLTQRAQAANISVLEVDGKGLFAEAVTKTEKKTSAKALLIEEFKDMPQRLIAATVKGEPKYNQRTRETGITLNLALDVEEYRNFVDRLTKLLDGLGGPSFTISSVSKKDKDGWGGRAWGLLDEKRPSSEINFPKTQFPARFMDSLVNPGNEDYAVLVVCSSFNRKMTSSRWKLYELDPDMINAINDQLKTLIVSVELLDNQNRVVDAQYLPLGKLDREMQRQSEGPITFHYSHGRSLHPYLFILPYVNSRLNVEPSFGSYEKEITFNVDGRQALEENLTFDLSPEDLAKVTRVVCKISPARR